jgi:hypothetical protein
VAGGANLQGLMSMPGSTSGNTIGDVAAIATAADVATSAGSGSFAAAVTFCCAFASLEGIAAPPSAPSKSHCGVATFPCASTRTMVEPRRYMAGSLAKLMPNEWRISCFCSASVPLRVAWACSAV